MRGLIKDRMSQEYWDPSDKVNEIANMKCAACTTILQSARVNKLQSAILCLEVRSWKWHEHQEMIIHSIPRTFRWNALGMLFVA